MMEARILDLPPDSETDPEAFYHPHEEDSVPVSGIHDAIVHSLREGLSAHLPEKWVASDLCCYWIPGNNRVYLAPDVFVAACARPDPLPSSYRSWNHGPLLLVVEVGSRTSLRRDVGPKLDRYAEGLLPGEYLYYDADHRDLRLHRREQHAYVRVAPDSKGRVRSELVGVSFAIAEDGFLRAFDASGNPLLTHAEEAALRTEAEQRAAEAEQRARESGQRAREAEQRAEEAERRAEREAVQRAELEQRLAALQAELARPNPVRSDQ